MALACVNLGGMDLVVRRCHAQQLAACMAHVTFRHCNACASKVGLELLVGIANARRIAMVTGNAVWWSQGSVSVTHSTQERHVRRGSLVRVVAAVMATALTVHANAIGAGWAQTVSTQCAQSLQQGSLYKCLTILA